MRLGSLAVSVCISISTHRLTFQGCLFRTPTCLSCPASSTYSRTVYLRAGSTNLTGDGLPTELGRLSQLSECQFFIRLVQPDTIKEGRKLSLNAMVLNMLLVFVHFLNLTPIPFITTTVDLDLSRTNLHGSLSGSVLSGLTSLGKSPKMPLSCRPSIPQYVRPHFFLTSSVFTFQCSHVASEQQV